MYKTFFVTLLFALMMNVFMGCQTTNKEDTADSSAQGTTAVEESKAVEMEYRAVCIEKEAHGGNNQILTRWLDSREKAEDYGREHGDFKYKGHRWIIEERVKPEQDKLQE